MSYNPRDYWGTHRRRLERHEPPVEAKELNNFKRWVKWCKAPSILEVGAGAGRIVRVLLDMGLGQRLTACDFVDYQRERCHAETGIMPDAWDGYRLPYDDGQFALVVSFDVLLHVPPSQTVDFMREHARVMGRRIYVATLDRHRNSDGLAPHCFVHDNGAIFEKASLQVIRKRRFGNRAHWLLKGAN